jgi:ATP-dependent RNA helicase HelY
LFCYQGRRVEWWDDTQLPTGTIRGRYEQLMAEHETLNDQERRLRLPLTRAPDPGFVDAAFRWAGGIPLTQLVDEDLTGGDFVRTSKLIIDLLRQIADLAPEPTVRSAASRAEAAVTRGVVKASLTVSGATEAASARPGSRSSTGTPGTLGPEPTSEAP